MVLLDDKFQILKAKYTMAIFLGDTRCIILNCSCQSGNYNVGYNDIFLTNSFGSVIIQIVILTLYLVKEFVCSCNALSTSVGVPGAGQDCLKIMEEGLFFMFLFIVLQNGIT